MKVKVITFERSPLHISLQFPYYYDADRQLYGYFGMLKASFWDLWGPRTLLAYLQLLQKGWKMLPSAGDIHQRGGDVLIDPGGRVRFHHIGSGPADRPDIERIFRVVERGRCESDI